LLGLADIGCNEELPETQETLQGNAKQKARHVDDNYGFNCFADDTGLEIDALNGEPGVYSARYAGNDCDAEDNMAKVQKLMGDTDNRAAKFRTVIHLVIDGKDDFFEGQVEGRITKGRSRAEGFGYDPIFLPDGFEQTFAEMDLNENNKISHRARAIMKLVEFLSNL
jgi:XTP/dITP diphosphohydrolase